MAYVLSPTTFYRHVKCTKTLTEEDHHSRYETTVTFCNFCKECLTFIDMGRRPPSFGHYLNVDMMKQFCHRDDSDRLHLVHCICNEPYVNLDFGHPDRERFGVCQGRRACLKMVGYPDRLCASCYNDSLTELQVHVGSCLLSQSEVEGGEGTLLCPGCQWVKRKDPTLSERLLRQMEQERKKKEEEDHVKEIEAEETKKEKSCTRKRKMLYLMDEALKKKQRNKLIR